MALSPTELAQIQADAAALLDQLCTTIKRTTLTPSNIGAAASTTTVASNVPCSLVRPTGALLSELSISVVGAVSQWLVSFAVGTDVRIGDTLAIGADTLHVESELAPRSYAALTQVIATEVE